MDNYLNHSLEWFKMITKTEFLRIRSDAIKHRNELKAEILMDECHTGLSHPLYPLYTRYNEIVNYYICVHGLFMDVNPEENRAAKQYDKEYHECFDEKIVEDGENYGHGILVCKECDQEFLLYQEAIEHYKSEHKEKEIIRKKKKDDERALARENKEIERILSERDKNKALLEKEIDAELKRKRIMENKKIAKLRKKEEERELAREEESIMEALAKEKRALVKEKREIEQIIKLRIKENARELAMEKKSIIEALLQEEKLGKKTEKENIKNSDSRKKEDERALAREEKFMKDILAKEEQLAEKVEIEIEIALAKREKLAMMGLSRKEKSIMEREASKKRRESMEKELLEKKRIEDELKEEILLKPWKDPDSLFCDTEFLEKPVEEGGLGMKNIRYGDECK